MKLSCGVWSSFVLRAVVVLVCLCSAGCARYVPSGRPGDLTALVQVGDEVRAYLRNGGEVEFEIVLMDRDHLYGEHVTVPRADVITIEVKEFSLWRTVAASVGGAVVTTFLVGFVALLIVLSDMT